MRMHIRPLRAMFRQLVRTTGLLVTTRRAAQPKTRQTFLLVFIILDIHARLGVAKKAAAQSRNNTRIMRVCRQSRQTPFLPR
jgi:hypothetical protein